MAEAAKARELKFENERLRSELVALRGYHADYGSCMEGKVTHLRYLVEGAESRAAEVDAVSQTLESDLAARSEEWASRGLTIKRLEARVSKLTAQSS